MNNYYKRLFNVKTAEHNDWHIKVDTSSNSAGHWSVEYVNDENDEIEEILPEELFEI